MGIPPAHFDPLIGWKKPGGRAQLHETLDYSVAYSANSDGFRGEREFTIEPGMRRIAFLGDSFTFGIGIDQQETFPHLIEGLLDETRSYNYGISGFGVDQMWMTLRHYAHAVDPDVVVVSFIWDDLRRARSAYRDRNGWWPKPAFLLRDGELRPMNANDLPTGWMRELEQRSHLFAGWESMLSRYSRQVAMGYSWHLNRALFAAIQDECELQTT